MLYIVPSYQCMQFQGKLINQTWENGKNKVIMVSYHHVQYQKKLMIQSWENFVTDRQMDWSMDGQTDGQRD